MRADKYVAFIPKGRVFIAEFLHVSHEGPVYIYPDWIMCLEGEGDIKTMSEYWYPREQVICVDTLTD